MHLITQVYAYSNLRPYTTSQLTDVFINAGQSNRDDLVGPVLRRTPLLTGARHNQLSLWSDIALFPNLGDSPSR